MRDLQLAALRVRLSRLRVRLRGRGARTLSCSWEAQFGDFVNGAQIVVDQFLVAGLSKWGQTSRLTLLLPHGYEGTGPSTRAPSSSDSSSCAAQENIRVANCTNAAQYFHLLRRQALDATARPLVVMTPKGLLRPEAGKLRLADLSEGKFEPVARRSARRSTRRVTRLVLCSGKVFYDIDGHEDRAAASSVAVARLEQLYPFPVESAAALTAAYPNLREIVWAQEEPQNMRAPGGRSVIVSRPLHPTMFRCATSVVHGVPARARATRPRIASSRTGSSARRWGRLPRPV